MSERIPANARKYIKQVRANRQKQKQKQSNKQSQVVIINQEPKRRRGPNKPKSSPASGGGGGGPSVIPYVIPQTQLTAASYQNSAVQPSNEIQQLTQALSQFQATPVYRNPFRMEPFRTAMNPAPLQQVEEPLPEPIRELPNPVMPDIVQEQNFVEQVARPPMAVPIVPSTPTYEGFAINQEQNDLARQQNVELKAYEDFGGYDAQSPREPSQAEMYQQELIRSQEKLNEFMSSGGGGGEQLARRSNTGMGRPFKEVSPFQQHGIELYITAREQGKKGNRNFLNSLSSQDREAYDAGRLLVTAKNRNNNPYIAEFINMIENKYN
jgi:hypothetical protein